MIDECGQKQLWPRSLSVFPGTEISREKIKAASFENTFTDPDKMLMVDAEQGRFRFTDNSTPDNLFVTYNYGFAGPCGAGFYERHIPTDKPAPKIVTDRKIRMTDILDIPDPQVLQINDSLTYKIEGDLEPVRDFTIQAKNYERPFIALDKNCTFSTGANNDSKFVMDGLWIGSLPKQGPFTIKFKGDFESIVIRNCTFDPGGKNGQGDILHPVAIELEGNVENFCIENSILSSILINGSSLLDESLCISDSILQSGNNAAIRVSTGITKIQRTTVLGDVVVHRLYSSDSIMTGLVIVTDNQHGCFRFSAAPAASILPGPYESLLFDIMDSTDYWFTSEIFGHPGFGQLSVAAPKVLYRGGENGAEMGAFNNLINAIKLDGLKIKIEEYMPFGLIPAFIKET